MSKCHIFNFLVPYSHVDTYSVMYHPKYLELLDCARNQAFKDSGFPIEKQFQEKVGFTVAGISDLTYIRPLLLGEEICVFTKVAKVTRRSCEVLHWIQLGVDQEADLEKAVFRATYKLVFVTIAGINLPLNASNLSELKSIEFSEKTKPFLGL